MNVNLLRALAAVCAALAVVLNGAADAKSIGELVLAIIGVVALVQAQLSAHAAKPEAHDTPPSTGA